MTLKWRKKILFCIVVNMARPSICTSAVLEKAIFLIDDSLIHVKNFFVRSVSEHDLGIFVDFKYAFDYLSWLFVLPELFEFGC